MESRGDQEHAGPMTTTPVLQRPRSGRVIAGVCAGLANRFGWNANIVRLLFILSLLLPGPHDRNRVADLCIELGLPRPNTAENG